MPTAAILGLVALGVVALVLVLVVVPKLTLGALRGPLEARITAHYGPADILLQDLGANSFGVESAGVWQASAGKPLPCSGRFMAHRCFGPRWWSRCPRSGPGAVCLPLVLGAASDSVTRVVSCNWPWPRR